MGEIATVSVRLPQHAVNQVFAHIDSIRLNVRLESPTLTLHCRQAGLPLDVSEVCGGLLASVSDDLRAIAELPRNRLERSKRMERVLAACEEPAASALRLAMACSPINGKACVRHWDVVCERNEVGRMAWLLGMNTDAGYDYGRKMQKRC